ATEAAEALQSGDLVCQRVRLIGLYLLCGRAFLLQAREFLPEDTLNVFKLHAWARRDDALRHASQLQRTAAAGDALRQLALIDESLVQPAGLGSAERIDDCVRVVLAWRVGRRQQPRETDLRQLHRIG